MGIGDGIDALSILIGDRNGFGHIAVNIVLCGVARLRNLLALLYGQGIISRQRDHRGLTVIINNGALTGGGVAGGIGDGVNHLAVLLLPLYLIGDVAVIVVDGGIALFHIRLSRASVGIRILNQVNLRRNIVHNVDRALFFAGKP